MKRLLLPLLAALALPTVLHADHKYPVKVFNDRDGFFGVINY
tara:strand:- start:854 stop:979 length:126 start_codon:yes stop_codon:yes gene_type:complete